MAHYDDASRFKAETIQGRLDLIDAMLANKWIDPSETVKLQSLGVVFGDAVAQELLLDWVVVDDEYGRDAALNWPGTSVLCHPLTMISKRVEDGEPVDVWDLFQLICDRLKELAFGAKAV